MKQNQKVFVALSGGVDSSVAVALLLEQGYEVIGCHIRCYNIDGCGESDAEDARRVAEQLGIPFYIIDLEKEYKEKVVQYMIDGYREGLTPNPDVVCNKEIKFGLFLDRALKMGADYVATGHYVRLERKIPNPKSQIPNKSQISNSKQFKKYELKIARDSEKDQSYFLWTLTQEQLKHCLFPIGDYTKTEVRKLAKKFNLLTANKKDSQGICFLGKVPMMDFLKQYLSEKPGNVLDINGNKIGEHRGARFYTIGQRRGLNYEAWNMKHKTFRKRSRQPFFIVDKNVKNNTITVSEERQSIKKIKLVNINLILPKLKIENCKLKIRVYARIRYRQPLQEAVLECKNSETTLTFKIPQKSVTSGQSAVFYDEDGILLGGGVIK